MDEIEVTPEMIQTGVDWLDGQNILECSPSRLVEAVYRAMERARLSQIVPITEGTTKHYRSGPTRIHWVEDSV